MADSVYRRVLGAEADALHPSLQAYFSLPPVGQVGHGVGVYEVAGSRLRWARRRAVCVGGRVLCTRPLCGGLRRLRRAPRHLGVGARRVRPPGGACWDRRGMLAW